MVTTLADICMVFCEIRWGLLEGEQAHGMTESESKLCLCWREGLINKEDSDSSEGSSYSKPGVGSEHVIMFALLTARCIRLINMGSAEMKWYLGLKRRKIIKLDYACSEVICFLPFCYPS